jgi:hypothetical protein
LFTRRRILGLAVIVIIILFSTWVLTTPPLLPVVGDKYAISRDYVKTGERMGEGWVDWCYTLRRSNGPVKTGTSWFFTILISKVSDNVTGPFYQGLTIRVNDVWVEDWETGARINDNVVHVFFDGETIVIFFYMLGQTSLQARDLIFELDYDVCVVLPIGYIPLKNHRMGISHNLTIT